LKPKTGFESGSSPTTATVRVSENGALIQTGRGLAETKRRIMEAFERSRRHLPAPPQPPQESVETVYAEHHEAHFHARATKLTLVALGSSHITKTKARGNGSEIVVPLESAEELIAEALRRFQ
jgi:hypothetical protein